MTTVTLNPTELLALGLDVNAGDINIGEAFSTLTRKYTLTSKTALSSYTFNYTEITASQEVVKIQEEDTPTQGFMELLGYNFTVPAGNTGDRSIFEIDIEQAMNVYQINMIGSENSEGDTVSMWIGPTYYIGAVTANLTAGDTSVVVSSVPLSAMKLGWTVGIKVGSNPIEPAGRIDAIDVDNSRLHFRHPTGLTAAAGSLIYAWVTRGSNIPLCMGILKYGQGKIGGSYVAKGLRVTFHYTNNNGLQKRFCLVAEDTY